MKLKTTALILALVLTFGLLVGCGGKDTNESGDAAGKVDATIILVLEDKSEVKHDLQVTAGSTLRQALYEANLISEETLYAMFVDNIDGHIADAINDGVTWLPCDADGNPIQGDGEAVTTFDSIKINGGETLRIVYSVVPNFDD